MDFFTTRKNSLLVEQDIILKLQVGMRFTKSEELARKTKLNDEGMYKVTVMVEEIK